MLARDDRLATRVGAIALVVVGALIALIALAWGRIPWGDHVRVRVELHDVGSLREGAPVVVGGRTVGTVEAIALAPGADGGVVVTAALDAEVAHRIGRGGEAFLASRGPLADRYLELTAGSGAPLADADVLRGADPPSIDRALQRTWENLTTASRFADEVRPELAELRTQVGVLETEVRGTPSPAPLRAESAAAYAEAARAYAVGLGGDRGLAAARTTIDELRAELASARATLAELDARAGALRAALAAADAHAGAGRLPDAIARVQAAIAGLRVHLDRIDPMLALVADLGDRLARGEGTLGKLMTDPEFPEDTKDLGKILKRHPWRILAHPLSGRAQ